MRTDCERATVRRDLRWSKVEVLGVRYSHGLTPNTAYAVCMSHRLEPSSGSHMKALTSVGAFCFIHCESNGTSSRFSVYIIKGALHPCISSRARVHFLRLDDIPQKVANDIQGLRLDLFAKV